MRPSSPLLVVLLTSLALAAQSQNLWVEARVLAPLTVALPKDYEPARSYPLVLLLHGSGGFGDAMLPARDRLGAASFILAAPQGSYPAGTGFRWFHPSRDPKVWAQSDTYPVDLIQRVILTLRQRYNIGGIYLLGHSEGAAVAYLVAARLRPEVAGVLAFGAGNPRSLLDAKDLAALKGIPHFLAHGLEDRLIPYAGLGARVEFWQAAGVPTTFLGYSGGHDLNSAPLAAASEWILKQEKARVPTGP